MIRLRRLLERGRSHPVLGPFVLVLLVFVLVMVFLHAAHDGHGAATELGEICLGIVVSLGILLAERMRRYAPPPVIVLHSDRGPPRGRHLIFARPVIAAAAPLTLALRR